MIRFSPIHDYLGKIEGLFENVEQISQGGYLKRGLPYFRGVSDESLELLPSAYRPNNMCQTKEDFQQHERDCLRSFMREARRYSSIPEDDVWNWTVMAQHHGVPTRLLDITRNPLVALWFSCLQYPEKDGAVYVISGNLQISGIDEEVYRTRKHKDIVSGILSSDPEYDSVKAPFVVEPYFLEERMAAQRSAFLVWGSDQYPLEENKVMADKSRTPITVKKIVINASDKKNILDCLSILGIDERSIYPGLDGIGRYIKRENI